LLGGVSNETQYIGAAIIDLCKSLFFQKLTVMQAKETELFRTFSYEEELQKAKWFKEDLEKGDGWTEAATGPGYTY